MNKSKKFIFLLLIVCQMLVLVSCGDSSSDDLDPKDNEEPLELETTKEEIKNLEEVEEEKEPSKKKKLIYKISPLFDDIYYEIVSNRLSDGKSEVISYIEDLGYSIEEVESIGGYKVSDLEGAGEYIYISFIEAEKDYVESINYARGEEDLEVSWSNLNEDRLPEYEMLQVYIPDYETYQVEDIESQIKFLKQGDPEDLKFDW